MKEGFPRTSGVVKRPDLFSVRLGRPKIIDKRLVALDSECYGQSCTVTEAFLNAIRFVEIQESRTVSQFCLRHCSYRDPAYITVASLRSVLSEV